MAMIICEDCKNEISDSAKFCPNCGKQNITETETSNDNQEQKKVSFLLGIGILFLPYIFSWFTLKKGYSNLSKGISFAWLALVFITYLSNSPETSKSIQTSTSSKPEKTQQQIKAEEVACKSNLQCWGEKHNISAAVYCDNYVEKLAKYSHEWTDGFLEPKFSHFRWKNMKKGYVTYIGDKIKFQNGFGAWQNYVYECDFNPENNQIIDVRAKPGRL